MQNNSKKNELLKKIYLKKEEKYYYQGFVRYKENNQIVVHFDCNKFQDKDKNIIDLSQLHFTLHNANLPNHPKTIGHFRTYNWDGKIVNSLPDNEFGWTFQNFSYDSFNFLTCTTSNSKQVKQIKEDSIIFDLENLDFQDINIIFILSKNKKNNNQSIKTFLMDDFYPILKLEMYKTK